MISDENLKRLHVGIKAGGSLVSHRPVFSNDSKSIYIVSGNTVYIYSTKTGIDIGHIPSPNADTIANIALIPRSDDAGCNDEEDPSTDDIVIFTVTGQLAVVSCNVATQDYNLLSNENIKFNLPKEWSKIAEWINIQCVKRDKFLVLAKVDSSDEEVMLYYIHRNLPGSFNNRNKNYSFYEFDKICWNVQPTLHSVSFGANGDLISALQDDSVFVMDYVNSISKWHKSGNRKFTCVAAHPTEWRVATGDDSGRILIWNNLFEKSPLKTVFHWHTLSVADLCFTVEGTQMLSGGGECTLVKWDVTNAENKRTLPRMGLPIRHICVAQDNSLFAVAHADNSIQLVNCVNEVETSIQNLTQGYIPETKVSGSKYKYFMAGVHLDPRTNSLVMNGKPGHLQCYSFREDKHLYSLDITQQNFITAERHKVIQNTDITQVAFSSHGRWLATGETLYIPETDEKCLELRLKFWEFDKEKQIFVLNTSIDWPHENGLECLKIQGIDDDDLSLMAASSGKDKLFKTWGITCDGSTLHDKKYWWNCENVGSYKNLNSGPLAFSRDGSVLAAAFSHTLTLWTCDNHEFRGSLCHTKLKEDLRMVEFGCHMSSHLVICCSQKDVIVWDVITLTLNWVVPLESECLAVDSLTNIAAVFSNKKQVFFFRPDRPEPLAVHKNISRSPVLSCVFVPSAQYEMNSLKSTLVFINENQELCAFLSKTTKRKLPSKKLKFREVEPTLTPFSHLTPERSVKEVDKVKKNDMLGGLQSFGLPGSNVIKELLDTSPHTMTSITYFCDRLLSSISVPRNLSEDVTEAEQYIKRSYRKQESSSSVVDGSDDESDGEGDSDHETVPKKRIETSQLKGKIKEEPNAQEVQHYDLDQVASEDTSWIESIFSNATSLD